MEPYRIRVFDKHMLDELRRSGALIKATELQKPAVLVSSGLEELDRVCGGGLPRGRIVELTAPACGASTVLYSLLASGCLRDELTALVDPADSFEIDSAQAANVSLGRLLWVRSRNQKEALQAMDLILSSRGFGTLVLDLMLVQKAAASTPVSAWMRIKRLAHQANTLVVVLSRVNRVGSFASISVGVKTRCGSFTNQALHEPSASRTGFCFELTRQKR